MRDVHNVSDCRVVAASSRAQVAYSGSSSVDADPKRNSFSRQISASRDLVRPAKATCTSHGSAFVCFTLTPARENCHESIALKLVDLAMKLKNRIDSEVEILVEHADAI